MTRPVATLASATLALGFILAVGASPACTCAGEVISGGGDAGGSDGSATTNACGDNDPSCTVVCSGLGCPQGAKPLPLPTDDPPPKGVAADGVTRDPKSGAIVLDSTKAAFDFLWIANDTHYGAGTVSKISTKPRATPYPNGQRYGEIARYASVTCQSDLVNGATEGAVLGAAPPATLCADGVHGCCARAEVTKGPGGGHQAVNVIQNRPSRTAVDFNGDVWVANRAHSPVELQSSVTKIANSQSGCLDRNKNGTIDTSSDANQDGIIDTDCDRDNVADSAATVCTGGRQKEFWGFDDECILFTVNTGPPKQWGRALALGQGTTDFGPADAWAGTYMDGTFYRIDGATGAIKATVKIQDQKGVTAHPYGAAIDQFGILWAPNAGEANLQTLFYFDTNDPTKQGAVQNTNGGNGFYGIAIDGFSQNGKLVQQVWLGEMTSAGAYRYRPVRGQGFDQLGTGTWARAEFTGTAQGRGIAVDNRVPARVWIALDGYVAGSAGAGVARVPADLPDGLTMMSSANIFPTGQVGTLGAAVAIDLDIWGVNQGSSSATHFKVDATGAVVNAAQPDQVLLDDKPAAAEGFCANPVGGQCKPHPYTYSDFTGFGLRNFTNPRGSYSVTQAGCGAMRTQWLKVLWDAEMPPGTQITMRARAADTEAALPMAPWTGSYTGTPADLKQMPGPLMPNPSGFIEVEFNLTTVNKEASPALRGYQILYECLGSLS